MKGGVRSTSRSARKRAELSFCRYLRPGALAQLRDSKITAKFKITHSQAQIALYQIESSPAAFSQSTPTIIQDATTAEALICFPLKINRARCLQRKKLVAIAPIFSAPQS